MNEKSPWRITTNTRENEPVPPSAREKIRSPHEISHQSVSSLVERWSEARSRTVLALPSTSVEVDCDDLFAELAYGARIAREATAGRWCAVATLLRQGAVESWTQVGIAMGMDAMDAFDGFHEWISGQLNLRRRCGKFGLTDVEANELYELAEMVIL